MGDGSKVSPRNNSVSYGRRKIPGRPYPLTVGLLTVPSPVISISATDMVRLRMVAAMLAISDMGAPWKPLLHRAKSCGFFQTVVAGPASAGEMSA